MTRESRKTVRVELQNETRQNEKGTISVDIETENIMARKERDKRASKKEIEQPNGKSRERKKAKNPL